MRRTWTVGGVSQAAWVGYVVAAAISRQEIEQRAVHSDGVHLDCIWRAEASDLLARALREEHPVHTGGGHTAIQPVGARPTLRQRYFAGRPVR